MLIDRVFQANFLPRASVLNARRGGGGTLGGGETTGCRRSKKQVRKPRDLNQAVSLILTAQDRFSNERCF